jgi:saccharolysin
MSGHYTDLSKKLDDELIDSLIRAKHLNGAFFMLQQLMFGAFDYKLHISKGDIDIPKLWNEMRGEVYNIGDTFTYGFTAIGHFMNGYDSGLYGYLWSEAFAADMYYTKFKADPMNNTVGREYRDKVIGRGATVDENVMLQDFLGREPNNEAFLEEQGIKV